MINLILYSDTYMPLFTLLFYVALWKYLYKKEAVIFLYSLFSLVIFGISNIMAENGIHNMPLYHISSLVEVWLISYYVLEKITGKKFSPAFLIINGLFTTFFVCNIIFWEKITVFNSNSAGAASLVLLFLSMYYLLALSKSDEILYFQKLPAFWIISGFVIYNAISVLVVLSYKYFVYIKLNYAEANLWVILPAANIVKFALIIIGLLCYRKRQVIHLPFLL